MHGQESGCSFRLGKVDVEGSKPCKFGRLAVDVFIYNLRRALSDLILDCVDELNGRWLVTSDHGNADDMAQRAKKTKAPLFDKETGEIVQCKSHTLAPVPVAIGGTGLPANIMFRTDLPNAGLANVTATYLNLVGFEAPATKEASLI